ncbi:hypothetical protein N7457_007492 [Penicillium paradoxum]|uniref:uncharacterized protein n=1 Tax=Penicillium paradoxum TaxID=176176 RepID=UPI00254662B2|nr:uncharacterized protein N7457_007492 [Penicillium paradoxum]KAJ5779772.1 hypothetical protein N7457_007492 [Penicillium paradoxum]
MGIFQIDFLTLWLMSTSLVAWVAAAPQPDTNGLCASYIIQGYDTCKLIAKAHGITEADIERFNKNTWSWLGCRQLYQGDFICVSTGNPPMPMALPHATCGPQVPGTVRPKNWADLAGLNPCAAPQCCSWWGACSNTRSVCELGSRAPPGGATATIKAPTTPPKSIASKPKPTGGAAAGTKATAKPATTQAAKPKTTQAATSKSTTSKSTTSKATTSKGTTTTKPTTTKPGFPVLTAQPSDHYKGPWGEIPWQFTIYTEKDCKGDYYHIEGYNRRYNDTMEMCSALRGGKLSSKWSEQGLTCKWWTDGGFTWKPCDKSPLEKPGSWIVKDGFCEGFTESECSCFDHFIGHYKPKGCQNRQRHDPPTLRSFMCAIEFD